MELKWVSLCIWYLLLDDEGYDPSKNGNVSRSTGPLRISVVTLKFQEC